MGKWYGEIPQDTSVVWVTFRLSGDEHKLVGSPAEVFTTMYMHLSGKCVRPPGGLLDKAILHLADGQKRDVTSVVDAYTRLIGTIAEVPVRSRPQLLENNDGSLIPEESRIQTVSLVGDEEWFG